MFKVETARYSRDILEKFICRKWNSQVNIKTNRENHYYPVADASLDEKLRVYESI